MTEPTFTPVDEVLEIVRAPVTTTEPSGTKAAEVELRLNGHLVACIFEEGAANWSDTKILAHTYLESLFYRGAAASEAYNESIFTLVMNTLAKVTDKTDFVTADWQDVKLNRAFDKPNQSMYLEISTPDGYDLIIKYMSPGMPWQEIVVPYNAEVPSIDELWAKLNGDGEGEWDNAGTIIHKGMFYSLDVTANPVITARARLVIQREGGDVIYQDNNLTQHGIIDVLLELYRRLALQMNYGDIQTLTYDDRLALQTNLMSLLNELLGLHEYTMLVNGLSASVRGSVVPDVQCMITHTIIDDQGRIRADFKYFNGMDNWSVERSLSFNLGEEPPEATNVYLQDTAQIRRGLGLDVKDMLGIDDVPFENRYDNEQLESPQMAEAASISAIVAVGPNNGIGMGSDLLWRIKEDMKFFKETTTGHVVVMGRKTFESIGRPLPNRQNIVVTQDPEYVLNLYTGEDQTAYTNLHCATSIEEAILLAQRLSAAHYDSNEIFIIGGGEIYKQCMPFTTRVYLTQINGDDSHADVFFPITGDEVATHWIASVLNENMVSEEGVSYARYLLSRKY
ncbi:putative dihydrofolate reductase [Salmonella phage vB_SalM_SA002]|nr:putative dihydrofolate reductase [Salmonella phage vB_SalM_SA002]